MNSMATYARRRFPPVRILSATPFIAYALSVLVITDLGCETPLEPLPIMLQRYQQAVALPTEDGVPAPGEEMRTDEAEALLPEKVLPLGTARAVALAANPDIYAALSRLMTARARIEEAQARFRPTVSFTHTATRTFYTPASRNRIGAFLQSSQSIPTDVDAQSFAVTTILNALRTPLFGQPNAKGNTNPFSEHSTSWTVSWTLLDGFIREAQTLAAKHLTKASFYSLKDVQRVLLRAVDSAYYQVQLAQEQVRIARADETFSLEQFEETKRLREKGRASRADVDNFRVRMLAAETNLSAAIGSRETGRVVLAELMGLEGAMLPERLSLSPLEMETEAEMAAPDAEVWLERAMANRPDLAQLSAIVDSEQENIRAVRGSFSPTLVISGSWGFDRSSSMRYRIDDQSAAGALEVRWDLYTGGTRRARLQQARTTRNEAVANLERLRLSVASEVRSATIELADAQRQILLQRQSLITALENRRIVQVGYLAGKNTLTRLNETQRDYIEADANLSRARIRLRQAWTDLRAAAAYPEPENPNDNQTGP